MTDSVVSSYGAASDDAASKGRSAEKLDGTASAVGGTEDRGPWTLEHEDRLGELYAAEAELASVEAERDRLRAELEESAEQPQCICDGASYYSDKENRRRHPFLANAQCVVHGARPAPEQPVEPEGDR